MKNHTLVLSLTLLAGCIAVATLLILLAASPVPVQAEPALESEHAALQSTIPLIRYVAVTGSDATTCTLQVSPCRTVQYAVDVAEEGDAILVSQGTYSGTNPVLDLSKTVTVRGGYTTTDWSTYNPISYPTTLDGRQQGRVIYVRMYSSPTIQGFHITGGNAGGEAGGGIFVGGTYPAPGSTAPTFIDNVIYANRAEYGGGIALYSSAAVVRSNTIISNSAGWGGGISSVTGDSLIEENVIANNFATDHGGGVALHLQDRSSIVYNRIVSNTARNYAGGGLYVSADGLKAEGNTILSNTAGYGGGIALAGCLGDCGLTNTIVANNSAVIAGGGIFLQIASAKISHSTIAHNGGEGSGIYVAYHEDYPTAVSLANTILLGHTVGITVAGGSTATLEGTLWGNETDWAGAGTILTGTVNVWGDPAFVDPDAGDYHIGPDSAAIDQGVETTVTTDIDGEERPVGLGPDIGADEIWINITRLYLPLVLR